MERSLASRACSTALTRWSTLVPNFKPKKETEGTMKLNKTRVWLGGNAGGAEWTAWGFFVGTRLAPLYEAIQKQGLFLKEPRYPFFTHIWLVLIFLMSVFIAHLYPWAPPNPG